MELRHLRYFVAVAEELHFRRAAERLHVAQPAVSEQVRKLEEELGVRLFDRTQRNVGLTDAGAALLPEASRVLRQAEAARLAARSASDRPGRVLRIGYVPTALLASIPRMLRHRKLSKMNFMGMGPWMMFQLAKKYNVSKPKDLLEMAQAMGVKFLPCQMTMDMFGLKAEDLIEGMGEPVGAATALALMTEADSTLFI